MYESFGIVNLEAMKNAVPVVAYDLPVYATFTKGMVKVPINNKREMAKQVLKLLQDTKHYKRVSSDADDFADNFSWNKTGSEVYQIITGELQAT